MNNNISRRHFTKLSLTGTAALVTINQSGIKPEVQTYSGCIRLGGLVFGDFRDPQEWIKAPLMLEHLKTSAEYDQAATNVRNIGASVGIKFC